nr:MAG TPA: H-type lectin domain [Caudoviricetes sp.]
MAIAGRVAIVPKGDWSADATYKRLDAVTYNNTLYFAKKEVPKGTITSNAEYWSKSIVGGVGAIATTEEVGIVKPDGKSMSVDESGTLSINLDGTTITLDEAKNVIKLADTLKDKINGAFPAANLINNLTTTEAGFGLDARQGKALDDKITEINGSLKMIDCGRGAFSKSDSAIDAGTMVSAEVTFNKMFEKKPIVVVSWGDYDSSSYFDTSVIVDTRHLTNVGFNAVARTKHADAWKYNWYFYWIAIAN